MANTQLDSLRNAYLRSGQPDDKIEISIAIARQQNCAGILDSAEVFLPQITSPQLRMDFYWAKADCFISQNKMLEGLDYLLKAEEAGTDDLPDFPLLLQAIAVIYDELEVFDKTLSLGLQAQQLAQKNNDDASELSSIYAIISGAYALGKFDLAKSSCQRGIELVQQNDFDISSLRYIYFLLGRTALAEQQADLAITHFQKSLDIGREMKSEEAIAEGHEGLAMSYYQKNDLPKAHHHAELAMNYEPPYLSDRTLGLTQIFAKNKEYQKAYRFLEEDVIKKTRRDSINSPSAIISELLTDKFTREKTGLEDQLEFQRALGFRNLLIGLAITALLFLTFLFFYNRKRERMQNLKLQKLVKEQTQEITEQKETLLALDQAKSRLYTNITHEFRTPLTVISGLTKGLDTPSEDKEIILRNTEQLLNLVNQLLDLQKLESGDMPMHYVQADLLRFIRYLTESFKSYADSIGVAFHFLTDVESCYMDFDKEKITRVVSNLLSNAVKFTPADGNVYVQLSIVKQASEKQLSLAIKDTGPGIPAEEIENIFDRFYQVDNAHSRKGEGTGIGLTLVKELLIKMNGEIGVNSSAGNGATFTMLLPITNNAPIEQSQELNEKIVIPQLAKDSQKVNQISTQSKNELAENLPTVLLIEDNVDVIHYLISCLQSSFKIEISMNGQEGIDKALRISPDIIVSDVMMPLKDGFEVCQTLKTDERSSHIPIVLLTAKADISSRLTGLQRGADAYLNKPFHQEELMITLQKLLALRKLLQARFNPLGESVRPSAALEQLDNNEKQYLEIEDAFLQKIRVFIEANLADNAIGMPQLMRALSMSRSQIYKKVKALTGKSPSRFIRSIRLHHAQQLLSNPELNISEIAYQTGFSSPAYFSESFVKEFGHPPTAHRL